MRADAHYVEQLDSSLLNSPIRFLEVRGLDAPRQDDDETPSAAFVESIRKHGVLQPLLVRSWGGRHLVIAGRKRLAAAAAAGLSRVPCLIERMDDEQAPIIAAATNTPSTDTPVERVATPLPAPTTDLTFAVFADCLTAVASSANLLSPGSTLMQTVAVDLVRAEAARALQLLVAARVLKGDISVARREVAVRSLIERAVEQTASERRLRGLTLDVPSTRKGGETVSGDEDLLAASLGSLILGPSVLFETMRSKTISLQVNSRADGTVAFSAIHDGAELPHYWRSRLAEAEWPDVSVHGGTSVSSAALVLLRSARRVAELHAGHMSLDCSEGRTSLSIVVPAGRA
jgi:hypothetical protein